jgi:hypothetical protein
VRVILSYQNSDGGMATYENTRSFHAMEVRALVVYLAYIFFHGNRQGQGHGDAKTNTQ